jgi:ABC-type Mn2+/Zn2+ transport system ATPase subunit/Holliday junction resolvase-like predicted endonuclease
LTSPSKPGEWIWHLVLRHGERIALVGPNGSGKTTLLKTIVGEIVPKEGKLRFGANVRVGYMPQKQDTLDDRATPFALIRELAIWNETEVRNFLHFFLFQGDEVFTAIGKLSYGERSRLLLAQLAAQGTNLLLLDEPINHLDIPSREQFNSALAVFPGTILAAVHDRAFIDRFATGIWSLRSRTICQYVDREEMARARQLESWFCTGIDPLPSQKKYSGARKNLGDSGERVAALFLQQRGYQIVKRSWQTRGGEIDLAAEDPDGLKFIEVRARCEGSGMPEESLTPRKRVRMIAMAMEYLPRH